MRYVRVGNSGLVVSALGYGANNLGRKGSASETFEGAERVVKAAVDAGITYFDTADVYGYRVGLSEEYLGKAVASIRDQVVIGTKFGIPNVYPNLPYGCGSRGYAIYACEQSLRRLGTDYIDLFYYHTPDSDTPLDETVEALETLVQQGKIRYYAVSNTTGWQLAEIANLASSSRFVATQNNYNLIDRRAEQEILPAAKYYGLGVIPYYPLAAGMLTGKYTDKADPEGRLKAGNSRLESADYDQLRAYADWCDERGLKQADVAIAWLASHEQVAAIIAGATRPEQIESNAKATEIELSADDLASLDEIFPAPEKVALF